MRKITWIILLLFPPMLHAQVTTSADSVENISDSLQNNLRMNSEIKITDIVKLAKYAQGAIVYESFFSYLNYLKPVERQNFLLQIVELIGHFSIDKAMVDEAIKISGIDSNNSLPCLLLKESDSQLQLRKIVSGSENNLNESFRLLLSLFSVGYQDGYKRNKNESDKFWYWDYSEVENALRFSELNHSAYVHIDKVFRP